MDIYRNGSHVRFVLHEETFFQLSPASAALPISASILNRCNRSGIGHQWRRLCFDRLGRAIVIQKVVKRPRYQCLCLFSTVIAHVVVLEDGITPGSVLKTGSLERNESILNLPSVISGTRRLSSTTTLLT